MRCIAAWGLFALFTVGCSQSRQTEQTSRATTAAVPRVAPGGSVAGIVRERIPVAPYVYVRVETDNGDLWVAVL